MPKVGNQAMCISVNGGYTASPTNLHLWDYTTAAEQGWWLEKSFNVANKNTLKSELINIVGSSYKRAGCKYTGHQA